MPNENSKLHQVLDGLFDLKAPRTVRKNIALESTSFGAAEMVGMGTSLGVVAVLDKIVPESLLDKATHVVSKVCVEPYLDTIEKNLAKCHLIECQADETKSREERAHRLAKGIVVFGSAYFISLGAKLGTRRLLNDEFRICRDSGRKVLPKDAKWWQHVVNHIPIISSTKEENMIFAADELAHIGSLIYLNTTASKLTDHHIHKTASLLEKLGISPKKSKEIAAVLHVWEIPNGIGMVAGLGTLGAIRTRASSHSLADVMRGRDTPLSI